MQFQNLPCRAGITGAATIAFAREETILDHVPNCHVESFYDSAVLSTKNKLDEEFMARATLLSDLKQIVDSAVRRWDRSIIEGLPATWASDEDGSRVFRDMADAGGVDRHISRRPRLQANTELAGQEYVSNS